MRTHADGIRSSKHQQIWNNRAEIPSPQQYGDSVGGPLPFRVDHLPDATCRSIPTSPAGNAPGRNLWRQPHQSSGFAGVHQQAQFFVPDDTHQDQIASFRENLKYVDGATGVAVAIGKKIVALDLFDKPSTCEKVWDRMLSGVVFDALEAGETAQYASVADVEQLVAAVDDLPWEQSEAVGEGDEFRAESKRGDYASALAFENVVVHGCVVAGV